MERFSPFLRTFLLIISINIKTIMKEKRKWYSVRDAVWQSKCLSFKINEHLLKEKWMKAQYSSRMLFLSNYDWKNLCGICAATAFKFDVFCWEIVHYPWADFKLTRKFTVICVREAFRRKKFVEKRIQAIVKQINRKADTNWRLSRICFTWNKWEPYLFPSSKVVPCFRFECLSLID